MTTFAWIGMIGLLFLTFIPFMKENYRTKTNIVKSTISTLIIIGIIVAVTLFKVNYILALLIGLILFILFDKKTYTKRRLITYSSITLIIGIAGYFLLSDNPDYVLNHLEEYPNNTSFYAEKNHEEIIAYEADTVRPLASTVKIIIAVEYAMQIDSGKLDEDSFVALADLNRFYIKGSDGGAHEDWLKSLEEKDTIKNNEVTLQDVIKGMITYSSNANTDYMINLLGTSKIDKRAKELGLKEHEPIYPLVGALLIPQNLKDQTPESLQAMSIDEYRKLAIDMSEKMQRGEIQAENTSYSASRKFERIWSDRLIGATARDYGKLLAVISNDKLPNSAMTILRDVMEWPMELNPDNQNRFKHLGGKGGSTAFILNDAIYAEELNGNKFELVLFLDNLKFGQSFLLQMNMNSFESKFIESEAYQEKVMEVLEND